MNNFWTVTMHTFSNRLKTKAFMITTLITVLVVAGFLNVDRIFEAFSGDGDEVESIAVIGDQGELVEIVTEELSTLESYEATNETTLGGEPSEVLEETESDYVLSLNANESGQLTALLYGNDVSAGVAGEIETTVQRVKESIATLELGLDEAELAAVYAPISFDTESAEASLTPERTEEETFQAQTIVYVLLFVIYFAVIIYGTMIATEVATEKSSRVMEILVSSVHPIVQMFGKIIGIGLTALLQLVILLVGAGLGLLIRGSTEDSFISGILGSSIPYDLVGYALVFLVLGFLLYGSLAAMLGSLVSRVEDVNTLIQPLVYMVMIAFFIAVFGLNNPDSMLVTVTSWIPFFSPIIMFLRLGLLAIPLWEVVLSFGVMIVSIIVFSFFAANVYKGGVIMYGSNSLFKGIKAALSLSKK